MDLQFLYHIYLGIYIIGSCGVVQSRHYDNSLSVLRYLLRNYVYAVSSAIPSNSPMLCVEFLSFLFLNSHFQALLFFPWVFFNLLAIAINFSRLWLQSFSNFLIAKTMQSSIITIFFRNLLWWMRISLCLLLLLLFLAELLLLIIIIIIIILVVDVVVVVAFLFTIFLCLY